MEKNNIIIVFLVLITYTNTILASKTDSTKVLKGISVSYWGIVYNNYGIQTGIEKYFLQTGKYKIIGSLSLVMQRRTDVYSSAGIIAGSTLRRTYNSGIYFEHGFRLGYLGSFYDFDFYKVNSNGETVNIGRKWTSSAIVGYALGFGYDFSKKTKADLQLFVKPNIYYRIPNNDNFFIFNYLSVEAGVVFHPVWFR